MSDRAGTTDMTDDGAIDLRALGRAIAARKWWIIAPTAAIVVATALYVSAVRPRYTADAKVFLDNQESYYTRPDKSERDAAPTLDPEAVASQVQIVTSREVAREAIRVLNLVGDPEFDPLAKGMSALDRIAVLLGLQRNPANLTPEDRTLETYYARLQVFQVPRTRVLAIEFTSERPELAARAANVIAEQYIRLRSNVKKGDALKARDWLAETIRTLKPRVEAAHLAVARYREGHGLQRGDGERSTVTQELGDLVAKLADARAAQSEAQGKAAMINKLLREGRTFEIPDVAKDELVRRIAEQRVNLRAQLALEMRTLLPGHPRVKELQSQVAELESELRAAAQKTARALENDATLATSKIKFLDAAVQRRRTAAGEGEEKDAALKLLEQEAAALDSQYQSAMAKFNEASARESVDSTPPDVRLVSPATSPQLPSFPKKIPMIVVALLGGLVLSSALVVTRALLNAEARVPRVAPAGAQSLSPSSLPIAGRTGPAAEAKGPEIGAPPVANGRGAQRTGPQFDDLRRAIEALRRDGEATRALVIGLDAREGVLGAVRLARSLARTSRSILIDLGEDAGVSDALGFGGDVPGLAEIADGSASFAETIHRDAGGRLHVLPAGAVTQAADADPDLFFDLLAALSESYENVVIAGPSADRALRQPELLSQVDVVALVAPLDVALGEARRTLETIKRLGVETVVLDSSPAAPRRASAEAARDAA